MASDPRITTAPTGRSSRKNSLKQVAMVWSAALRLPRARCWEVRLDTAEVSPTAVRAISTEFTGMISWYSPITSAPTSRESTTR